MCTISESSFPSLLWSHVPDSEFVWCNIFGTFCFVFRSCIFIQFLSSIDCIGDEDSRSPTHLGFSPRPEIDWRVKLNILTLIVHAHVRAPTHRYHRRPRTLLVPLGIFASEFGLTRCCTHAQVIRFFMLKVFHQY